MEINIRWNICRVCLTEEQKKPLLGDVDGPMCRIFDEDKLVKQIYECSGITMKPNDNLPEKICKKCMTMVKYAVIFRETCRASDTHLHSILQRTKNATNLFKEEQPQPPKNLLEEISDDSISYNIIESESEQLEITKSKSELYRSSNFGETNRNTDDEENFDENNINFFEIENEFIDDEDDNELSEIDGGSKDLCVKYFEESKTVEETYDIEPDHETVNENIEQNYAQKRNNNDKQENNSNVEDKDRDDENGQITTQWEIESEQDIIQNLKSNIDDDHDQVSSTVIAKEDDDMIEIEETNLPSSEENEMETEYIIDDYLIDDSKSDLSSKKSSMIVISTKPTKSATNTLQSNYRKAFTTSYSPARASAQSKNQVYVCDLCGNNFNNRMLLKAHMKIHRQEKNHECELCSKRFITACNLQAHMRVHTGEKPFECQYCGRRFSDRSSNLRHERTHTNEKPYECKECGKAFSLGTTLKKHQKVHTGERLYGCDICAKSFKLLHQLKAHKNTTLHKAIEQLVQQDE